MYACMYPCMHACMHVCMHACMHACMHLCMYACTHECMHACMHTCPPNSPPTATPITYIYLYFPLQPATTAKNIHQIMQMQLNHNSSLPMCGNAEKYIWFVNNLSKNAPTQVSKMLGILSNLVSGKTLPRSFRGDQVSRATKNIEPNHW